jgi:asparagine synthase (glutamine-hydrolysing)
MSDFHGTLTVDGARLAGDAVPETHLGCEVVVSGFVAGRVELGRRLGAPAGASEAELVAHAYRRWGDRLAAHVHGEYAAAVMDRGAGTALLTHDALGLATLFYSCRGGRVRFATDLADLAAAGDELDREYIADFLAFGFITGARTPFAAVRRVLPGTSLVWSAGRLRERRAWSLSDVERLRYGSDGEYEEHLRALLGAAVDGSLDPEHPTWISLSGGLDSSSIACVAAAGGDRDLAALSVLCSAWPEADESPWMRSVVERYELPWHTIELESMLPFTELPRGVPAEPTQAVIEETRLGVQNEIAGANGARVLLTGHAGDAVLCASPGAVPFHLADPLFSGRPLAAIRSAAAWRRGTTNGRSHAFWLLRGLAEPALRHVRGQRLTGVDLARPLPPWVRPEYDREWDLRRRVHREVAPRAREPGRQGLAHDLWVLSLATGSAPRRRMAFEVRRPLLYLPLVEFMAAIPWEQKLRPDQDRYLQRRALRGVLPEEVRTRTGKANGNPALVEGLRRSRDWVPYLTEDPAIAEHGIVEADEWHRVVRRASVGQTHDDKIFLAAVALEVWLRHWARPRAAAPRVAAGSELVA